jgi:hypothetical protein
MEEFVTLYRVTWEGGGRSYGTAYDLIRKESCEVLLHEAVKVEAASIPPELWFDVSRQALPWGPDEEEE